MILLTMRPFVSHAAEQKASRLTNRRMVRPSRRHGGAAAAEM